MCDSHESLSINVFKFIQKEIYFSVKYGSIFHFNKKCLLSDFKHVKYLRKNVSKARKISSFLNLLFEAIFTKRTEGTDGEPV